MNEETLAARDEQLEARIMQNFGTILALDCAIFALIYTHPDKAALAAAFDDIAGRMTGIITGTVMMVDELSVSTHKLSDSFNQHREKIISRCLVSH